MHRVDLEAPLRIDIVAHAPTEFFHCLHCELVWRETGMGRKIHAEQRQSALPPDLAAQYAAIGGWIQELAARYGDRVECRVIDVLSLEGFYTSLRHRLGRFPAYIVGGRSVGSDLEAVAVDVERRLAGASAIGSGGAQEG